MRTYLRDSSVYKLRNELFRNGELYSVWRKKVNEYGEPVGVEEVREILGLFHISESYESPIVQDGTSIHSRGAPMVLIEYEKNINIKKGDFFIVDGTKYGVVSLSDIQMYHIAIDISLEVVIDG